MVADINTSGLLFCFLNLPEMKLADTVYKLYKKKSKIKIVNVCFS